MYYYLLLLGILLGHLGYVLINIIRHNNDNMY